MGPGGFKLRLAVLAAMLLAVPIVASAASSEPGSDLTDLELTVARYRADGAEAALPLFESLLADYRQAGDRAGEAAATRYVGECHWRLGNLSQSGELLEEALRLSRLAGDRHLEGRTLNVLGLLEWDRGDYESALVNFGRANAIAIELDDRRLAASTLNNRGLVRDELGDYRTSLDDFETALRLFEQENDRRGQGDALGNIGGVHLLLGRYALALQQYQMALAISEELGLKPAMTIDHGNIAMSLLGLGRTSEALEHFDQALALARDTGMVQEEAYWQRGKGNALISQGAYDLGLEYHQAALAAYQASGARTLLLSAQHDMGMLTLTLGDLVTAEKWFQRAVRLAREIGHEQALTENLLALGDLNLRRDGLEEADALYQEALTRAATAGEQQLEALALLRLARLDRLQNRQAAVADHAQRALIIAQRIESLPIAAEAWFEKAEAARGQSAFDQALEGYGQSQILAGTDGDPVLLWQIHYGRALGLEQKGELEAAVTELESAVRVIEGVRERLSEDRYRAGWVEDKYRVYVDLVRLQLELGKTQAAFSTAERLRARSFLSQLDRRPVVSADGAEAERQVVLRERIRQLQRALTAEQQRVVPERRQAALNAFSTELMQAEREFQAYLDDRKGSSGNPGLISVPDVEQLQDSLDEASALLEYVVGERGLVIFVVRKGSLVAITLPLRKDELAARVDLLRELIQQPEGSGWRKPAGALATTLLAPVQRKGLLTGIRHLDVVPHGILNYLPFALLPMDGPGQRLLIEEFTLAYLPAAAALALSPGSDPPVRSLLAMAPERSRLRFASREAASVAELFEPGARLLLGKQATESAFKLDAGQFRILHFATHGVFNRQNPLLSGLELEADERNDGLLEVHEILGLRLGADLVTLSACKTGLGSGWFTDFPAGDDFVGLARAFLMAGSRSVLASLWEVDDRSTVELMKGFYRQLERDPESGRAKALADVQRGLHASKEFNHPFYWAPFVLVGRHAGGPPGAIQRGESHDHLP